MRPHPIFWQSLFQACRNRNATASLSSHTQTHTHRHRRIHTQAHKDTVTHTDKGTQTYTNTHLGMATSTRVPSLSTSFAAGQTATTRSTRSHTRASILASLLPPAVSQVWLSTPLLITSTPPQLSALAPAPAPAPAPASAPAPAPAPAPPAARSGMLAPGAVIGWDPWIAPSTRPRGPPASAAEGGVVEAWVGGGRAVRPAHERNWQHLVCKSFMQHQVLRQSQVTRCFFCPVLQQQVWPHTVLHQITH